MSKAPLSSWPVQESRLGIYGGEALGLWTGLEQLALEHPDKDILRAWMPGEAFVKCPADQAMAFNRLCINRLRAHEGDKHLTRALEVAGGLFTNHQTGEKRIFINPQATDPAFVADRAGDVTRPPIDLLTGEKMECWWEDWYESGRFHSHNTMSPTPSGTDDTTELKTPGICAIFGSYKATGDGAWKFSIGASIVTPLPGTGKNVRRTKILEQEEDGKLVTRALSWDDLIDWDADSKATFHKNVLDNIFDEEPADWEPEKKVLTAQAWKSYGYGDGTSYGGTSYDDGDGYQYVWTEKDGWTPTKKGKSTSSSPDYLRWDETIDAALNLHGVAPDMVRWRFRLIMDQLDHLMADAPDAGVMAGILDLLLQEYGLGVYDQYGGEATQSPEAEDCDSLAAYLDYMHSVEEEMS